MATLIDVKVEIDISGIEDHFRDLCNDKTAMLLMVVFGTIRVTS